MDEAKQILTREIRIKTQPQILLNAITCIMKVKHGFDQDPSPANKAQSDMCQLIINDILNSVAGSSDITHAEFEKALHGVKNILDDLNSNPDTAVNKFFNLSKKYDA